MDEMDKTIGKKIRKVRELKNFSQRYIADKLSMNQSTYSDLENGKIAVSAERLQKIADALEVSKEVIEHFSEQMVFNNCSQLGYNYNQTIYNNPIEKIDALHTELVEQLKAEIASLKETLKAKDELIALLKEKK